MTKPMHRSRTLRREQLRTPGNRSVMHFLKRKPNKAKCAICGKQLSGVPIALPSIFKHFSKTQKRPERKYGGNLCPECSREQIKKQARQV